MPDLVVTDIPETVFSVIKSLASEKRLGVEEFVNQLICDTVAIQSLAGGKSISIQQLQGNIDAYFRLAEHEAISSAKANSVWPPVPRRPKCFKIDKRRLSYKEWIQRALSRLRH